MATCVFDLDNTLGDFRVVDYFGHLYQPSCILGFNSNVSEYFNSYKQEIDKYDESTLDYLHKIRNAFEKKMSEKGFNEYIMRPKIKDILLPLVKEYRKGKIDGFIIYSNNANLYVLEYAGRVIENMFHEPKLFLHYLDRNNKSRIEFDSKDGEGYRTKTVDTIKKLLPDLEDKKILFMDDLIHEAFMTEDITYVQVPRYTSNIKDEVLENIWNTFVEVFNQYPEFKEKFFDLYHIKNHLNSRTFDEIKGKYLQYSKMNTNDVYHNSVFTENLTMIKNKIAHFINIIDNKKKKRKTRKYKSSRKKANSKKFEIEES